MKPFLRLVVSIVLLAPFGHGCAEAPRLNGKIEGLQKIAEQAERNGAIRCAPRELAIAKSELEFAKIEMAQGSLSRAKDHVFIAEPNANAATFLSPPQYCAQRQFVEPGDRDGDGYADPDDNCPDEPENFNGFKDEDGCPDDPDTDGDGIPDSADSCVLEPEDMDKYLDEDGCPEIDNDLDGILDAVDKCPNEPEDPDGFEDEDGCPEPGNGLVIVTDCEVKIMQQIHFEFNKSKIRPESFPVLDAVVEVLNKAPDIRIEVQGHTDNRGGAAYNKRLSDQRSASVREYLTAHGITSSRLTSHGYGFDRPLVPNDTDQNRALNRRVQFVRTEGAKEGCPPTSK